MCSGHGAALLLEFQLHLANDDRHQILVNILRTILVEALELRDAGQSNCSPTRKGPLVHRFHQRNTSVVQESNICD